VKEHKGMSSFGDWYQVTFFVKYSVLLLCHVVK